MTRQRSRPISFIVPGRAQPVDVGATRGSARGTPSGTSAPPPLPAGLSRGRIVQSVRLAATRGGGDTVRVDALPGEDVVVLHIAGGPALVLHPDTARDLMLAQSDATRNAPSEATRTRGASARANDAPGEVQVPVRLQWRGLEAGIATRGSSRGFLGDVVLSGIDVIKGVVADSAADLAAEQIAERVDAQVVEGVYALRPDRLPKLKGNGTPLEKLPSGPDGAPLLVFVHGTFCNTNGTFGKLWTHFPDRVGTLFKHYGDRVYALDHATLGVSPIENALSLAQALRPGTRLHLVTHSRGGLVAEALARVCARPTLGRADLAFFEGDDYATQREALKELARVITDRKIQVDRVVRVACPVRGTLLASKRLDAYVSVLKWTMDLAGVPVAPAVVEFLGEVAQRRADPALLPGLAAQIPDSPLVQWLHTGEEVAGDLRVIAGDVAGDSVVSWLKTLLSDSFFWTDNDLVVQTRSMYGGAPRAHGATFLLDQGGGVSHCKYFSNERTADAIVDALVYPKAQGFSEIGPLSWAGQSSTGLRGGPGTADDSMPASDMPAVILLPDVLGSHLKVGDERVWLSRHSAGGLHRLTYDPKRRDDVEPDGLVEQIYGRFADYLSKDHEVIELAYDWRLPIETEARRLATSVTGALDAREKSSKSSGKPQPPVRIVAHGMGGLIVRALQLNHADVWGRMLAHPDARILMLGAPNGGSWTPMQVLSGDETFGNTLIGLAAPFRDQSTRQLIAGFPGVIQMQAGLADAASGLAKEETWRALAEADIERVRARNWWHDVDIQLDAYAWGIPTQDVLDGAVALRKRLDSQAEQGFGKVAAKLLTVIGKARFTPDGFETGDDGLVYRDAVDAGDGRVTLQNALLPGVRTWTADCEHGSLPADKESFQPYVELLRNGDTKGLARLSTGSRARGAASPEVAHERSRPSRRRGGQPPASIRDPLSTPRRDTSLGSGVAGTALRVTVINGNLKFIRQPLVLGHYRSLALTGSERVMDGLIGGTMDQSLRLGQYPDLPTSHQVFVNRRANPNNPLQMPRPEAVIIVGLGEEGKLTSTDLTYTVRQGVIAWAQRLAESAVGTPAQFDLAATLIGSGGAGISAGQSAVLVAQGVREANLRLIDFGWPTVGHLHLIELYLDRASEAWRALQVQNTASPGQYTVAETVHEGTGALGRPLDSSYRGADYDLVTAVSQRDARGESAIAYRLDTKRARTEIRAQAMQGPLLRDLVLRASNDQNTDAQIGRTLFQLLVPPEMEPFLGGTTAMVLELDSGTAGIPWELLDSPAGTRGGADSRPWAIRSKLLRKLRMTDFRPQVVDADVDAHVLVIGEPKCDDARYPSLPGAREEARAVAQRFIEPRSTGVDKAQALAVEKVKVLVGEDGSVGADARTIMNAVLERDWRIVHIAGHGEPPEESGAVPVKPGDPPQRAADPRGVVLSNGTFLGPREIHSMRVVPELVFVNCCHLAARNADQLLERQDQARYDRAGFAAGVAEELIEIGVRCVVAAGWAVEDGPAMAFATTFYDQLLTGSRFIDAVAAARLAAKELGGNTWAAYQCYGDPDWRFRRETADAQRPVASLSDEFASVASSPALILALDTLATRSKYDDVDLNGQRQRIRYLAEQFGARWGGRGEVAEAFGRACGEAKDWSGAINWYDRAVNATDGTASMKATEQLGNLRARLALETVERGKQRVGGKTRVRRSVVTKARDEMAASLQLLEPLALLRPSIERYSLCGSAWKRRAMLESIVGDSQAELDAVVRMKSWYEKAESFAREHRDDELFYPALNRIAAELIVDGEKPEWPGFDQEALAEVRRNLETKARDDPDFWSVVGLTELQLYEALARGDLASKRESIEREFENLHERVSDERSWDSVYVQLRFVLPKYEARASPAERAAVAALARRVREFARRTGPFHRRVQR